MWQGRPGQQTLAEFRATYTGPSGLAYGIQLSTWAWIAKAPCESDGWQIVAWIQGHCCYTTGPLARSPIRLRWWQVAEVVEMFRTENGQRVYRRGLLGLPRKNGKSLLCACLALYMLCGDGEAGAQVYSAAGDRDQAKIVFREAATMVVFSPELARILQVRDGYNEIRHPDSRSWYRALSAESYTAEGLNPSGVLFDEVHTQPDHKLWDVMTLGSSTREHPFILGITTAGYDKETLCGRLYDAGRKHEAEGTFNPSYFKWYEGDAELDWRDPANWETCNPGLDDFLRRDGITDELQNGENAFKRYRLDIWTSAMDAWLPSELWNSLATDRELLPGEGIVIALDGSYNNDSTALVACTTDEYIAVIGVWEKQDTDDDAWKVPILDVMETIRQACKTFEVEQVVYDPYRFEMVAQTLEDEGIPMIAFPQTTERMTPATQEFQDAVIRDKSIHHNGDARLARHIDNVFVKETPRGPKLQKESKASARKIDLAVAAVMAHKARAAIPEGRFNIY